jgi:steroid delta-isomerase-like uncharacterized protein
LRKVPEGASIGGMGEPLDQQFLDDFAERWWAAWNERAFETMGEMVAPDVVHYNPAVGVDLHGRDTVVKYWAMLAEAFPDGRFTVPEPPYASLTQPKALVPWRFRGTHTGDFVPLDLKATGTELDVEGVNHWWFRDGLIAKYRANFDFADTLRAIDAAATAK